MGETKDEKYKYLNQSHYDTKRLQQLKKWTQDCIIATKLLPKPWQEIQCRNGHIMDWENDNLYDKAKIQCIFCDICNK